MLLQRAAPYSFGERGARSRSFTSVTGAQKLFYICCTLSSNGPARFHSSIRLPHCNHSPAYHHVFYVIGAHPSTQGHGSERWLQTIHVEEERAIITLDERCHSAAPAKRGTDLTSHAEHTPNTQTNVANHFSFSFPTNCPMVCYLHLKFGFRFGTLSIWTFCKTHLRPRPRTRGFPGAEQVLWQEEVQWLESCKHHSGSQKPLFKLTLAVLSSFVKSHIQRSKGNLRFRLSQFSSDELCEAGTLPSTRCSQNKPQTPESDRI